MKISVCTVCVWAGIRYRYLRIKSSKHYLLFVALRPVSESWLSLTRLWDHTGWIHQNR